MSNQFEVKVSKSTVIRTCRVELQKVVNFISRLRVFLEHSSHLLEVGLLAGLALSVESRFNRLAQVFKEQVKALDVCFNDVELEQTFIL